MDTAISRFCRALARPRTTALNRAAGLAELSARFNDDGVRGPAISRQE
ncbi:hypothetical protein ANO14919_144250 [Xylariales sp. No.14919]|nr:hypothetical protein ANO14919_144250 [Xylariales sp. No.14919]